ncbi:hypothetical protein QE152_g19548 [Popillia japonica]|uniref:Uncharacterized protein n=1 Tax=Popillia japonica TaxID=7064 RepID=A0AAW1KR36_POPJA
MEDLKNVIVAEKYSQEIQDNFNKADDINTVESKWKKLEKSIKAATERQLTKQKGNRKKEWLDEECKTEIEKRKRLRIRLLESQKEIDKIKFQEQRKKVKRLCRQRKRRAMERKLRAMEDKYKRKEIRNFYKDAKEIRKGHNGRTIHYKNRINIKGKK